MSRLKRVMKRMPKFKEIDYEFRPESYWDFPDPLQAIQANVKGTERREIIRTLWKAGRIDELPDTFLQESLSEEERTDIGRIHPIFMGGEYLPDLEPGEIEIARVELKSTTADAISVRAKKRGSGILYSVVDEYETEFRVAPAYSEKPLTLGKLVAMMDRAVDGQSLGMVYTLLNYDYDDATMSRLERLRSFTRVTSDFYPQLSLHYKKVTDLWTTRRRGRLKDRRRLSDCLSLQDRLQSRADLCRKALLQEAWIPLDSR
jgi:hypothetical protein